MRGETARVPENQTPAGRIGLWLRDQQGEIRVLIDPPGRLVETSRPGDRDRACNLAESCDDSICVTPLSSDVENFHAAGRSCGNGSSHLSARTDAVCTVRRPGVDIV